MKSNVNDNLPHIYQEEVIRKSCVDRSQKYNRSIELQFDSDGLLPSLIFDKDGKFRAGSPYQIGWDRFLELFAFNELRKKMIENFVSWDVSLLNEGIRPIRHWVSGSFIDRVDSPSDIDVLTFYIPQKKPVNSDALARFKQNRIDIFNRETTVKIYGVEPQFICLLDSPEIQNQISAGWANLYSVSQKQIDGKRRGIVAIQAKSVLSIKLN